MAAAVPCRSRRGNSAGAASVSVSGLVTSGCVVLTVVTLPSSRRGLARHGTLTYRRSGTSAYRRPEARMNTVTLPDGPSLPRFVQGGVAIVAPLWMMRRLHERYGSAFKINVPIFGDAVVISDPAEAKQFLMTSPHLPAIPPVNLPPFLGP